MSIVIPVLMQCAEWSNARCNQLRVCASSQGGTQEAGSFNECVGEAGGPGAADGELYREGNPESEAGHVAADLFGA